MAQVANDLKVKLSGAPRDDTDIARAIAHVLEWSMQVPERKVHARVQDGWAMLEGEVEYEYQRHEVERMVRSVRDVVGVTDLITVKPAVSREKVQSVIEDAFRREAEIDARRIRVEVSDHTAKLYGHVHALGPADRGRGIGGDGRRLRRDHVRASGGLACSTGALNLARLLPRSAARRHQSPPTRCSSTRSATSACTSRRRRTRRSSPSTRSRRSRRWRGPRRCCP
jgi:hypothetical protein